MKNEPAGEDREEIIERLIKDDKARREVVRGSFYWFFCFYFAHYIGYPFAPFHREMMRLLEDEDIELLAVTAFRGSGKSTIVTTAYALWSMLGGREKRYVIILSLTKEKAQQHLMNIRRELETNELLKRDLGPFREEPTPWGSQALVLKRLGAKIAAGSTEQSVRGTRHGSRRPDLFLLDDIEDIWSVRTRESRDKTWDWLTGEVIPAGDRGTRLAIVGNMLHEDSVMRRLEEGIGRGDIQGVFRSYPLLDGDRILWPGKYPTIEAVEAERKKVMDERAWQREYLLNILPDDFQVVDPAWIQYYDELPPASARRARVLIGTDLAISDSASADYTTMVPALVIGQGDDMRIYILPQIVNERIDFPSTVRRGRGLFFATAAVAPATLLVEKVAYQASLEQQLKSEGVRAKGVAVRGDKRERLAMTTPLLQSGKVLLPRKGAEALIAQIVGFGVEKHDDLADAFSLVVNEAVASSRRVVRTFVGRVDKV